VETRGRPPEPAGVQTQSRLRPLRRRDDSTSRPPLVSMRERKPCFFLRRRLFGWNVRFMSEIPCDARWRNRHATEASGCCQGERAAGCSSHFLRCPPRGAVVVSRGFAPGTFRSTKGELTTGVRRRLRSLWSGARSEHSVFICNNLRSQETRVDIIRHRVIPPSPSNLSQTCNLRPTRVFHRCG